MVRIDLSSEGEVFPAEEDKEGEGTATKMPKTSLLFSRKGGFASRAGRKTLQGGEALH